MNIKELQLKIEAMEKEIAELKTRQPIVINYPSVPCQHQHYLTYPYGYPNPICQSGINLFTLQQAQTNIPNYQTYNPMQGQLGAGQTSQ